MSLSAGIRLGPYEIVAPLGAGGMGEVYRARDTRLGRDVAIKVLPAALVGDPERRARFEREARLLASLSHGGIAAVHGVEESGGAPALVMELVEGPTLAERIATGAVPIGEALPIARQIAEALEFAHERGIVHRDLKPANVKVRPDGAVKVLDFGLARALEAGGAQAADLSQSPTLTQRMTHAGVILGTAAYMSPEQARGREADRRTDIWSFGVVLYEMLTGARAFGGDTASETLAAVMRDDPDWTRLPRHLDPRIEALIRRCLTKDLRQRLQSIAEARIALEEVAARPVSGVAASLPGSEAGRASRLAALAPWLLGALAVMAGYNLLGIGRPAPTPVREVSVVPPPGEVFGNQNGLHYFALSPDARTLAYTIRRQGVLKLHLRRLDRRSDVEVAGTDNPRSFFFSPDGEWLGFFDRQELRKVSVRGGTPEALAPAGQERLGTWLDDGTIVYCPETTSPLYRIGENGGAPIAVTRLDSTRRERTHRHPCALDGGPWVVFTVGAADSPGDYDGASIDAVHVKTGERRHLVQGARRAAWAPSGHLVFARGSDLYAVPIDPRNPRITGKPLPVLSGVAGDVASGASYFSIADDGTIAWEPAGAEQTIRDLGWFDRKGRWTPTLVPPAEYRRLALSPDGARVLAAIGQGGGAADLWLGELGTGRLTRLTFGSRSVSPAWLPDGQHFVYVRNDSTGAILILLRRVDGAGGERVLRRMDHPVNVCETSSDGRFVLYSDYGSAANRIHLAPTSGEGEVRDVPSGGGSEQVATLSPDQAWMAVVSGRTHREEVIVRRFGVTGGTWQVSSNGGGGVRWGRQGRELFFVTGEQLVRVPIEVHGQELVIGQPETLFDVPPSPVEASLRDYAYDPIGDRFLFTRPPRGIAERREIALSLRWASRLPELLKSKGAAAP